MENLLKLYNMFKEMLILSDEEELAKLTKTKEDKLKFQKAIDDVCCRGLIVEVELGGKKVKIEKRE